MGEDDRINIKIVVAINWNIQLLIKLQCCKRKTITMLKHCLFK